MSWYYVNNAGVTLGPVTQIQLKLVFQKGDISKINYVWNGGSVKDWVELETVGELRNFYEKKPELPKVPSDDEKSFTKCSVCMKPYDPNVPARMPKLLICAHTFCMACLDGLLMKNLIVCPTCKAETVVKDGVNKLHKNIAVIEVLSSGFVPPQTAAPVCSNCKKNPASMYCPQCDGEMCEECMKSIHQIAFFASHEPVKGRKQSAGQCPDHQKELELFCEEDKVAICMMCNLFGAHKGHRASLLQDKAAEREELVRNQLQKLKLLSDSLNSIGKQLEASEKTVTRNSLSMVNRIRDQFKQLNQKLNERQDYLISEAQKRHNVIVDDLQNKRKKLAVDISKLTVLSEESKLLLSNDNKAQVMAKVSKQLQKIGTLYQEIGNSSAKLDGNADTNVNIQFGGELMALLGSYGAFEHPPNTDDDNKALDCPYITCNPWKFTTLGTKGFAGPTSVDGYKGTPLEGNVTISSGIQHWKIPQSGSYAIEVAGSRGGSHNGGSKAGCNGATMKGTFDLNAGQTLDVLVGQIGFENPANADYGGGGGGGTFVVSSGNPLIVAGGGSGAGDNAYGAPDPQIGCGTAGNNGNKSCCGIQGGSNGSGGTSSTGGGGGGFNGDGTVDALGGTAKSFVNGGVGGGNGHDFACGGFGGGGGSYDGGGAGGGYSGGGGCNGATSGGGGSYNSGTSKTNSNGSNAGEGYVTIEKL